MLKNRRQRRAPKQQGCITDVAGEHSTPRVTTAASKMNLQAAWAVDLTQVDPEDGKPWDFDLADKRERARALLREEKPAVLIGSPCCAAWSSWQALNKLRRDPEMVRREMIKARVHLVSIISLYIDQIEAGRLFPREHPA